MKYRDWRFREISTNQVKRFDEFSGDTRKKLDEEYKKHSWCKEKLFEFLDLSSEEQEKWIKTIGLRPEQLFRQLDNSAGTVDKIIHFHDVEIRRKYLEEEKLVLLIEYEVEKFCLFNRANSAPIECDSITTSDFIYRMFFNNGGLGDIFTYPPNVFSAFKNCAGFSRYGFYDIDTNDYVANLQRLVGYCYKYRGEKDKWSFESNQKDLSNYISKIVN